MKKIPSLHIESHGSGPTVVLLHGFLASSRYWKNISALASKNYRVVAIDLLGFGESPKPLRNSYRYEDHINSINKTLEKAGVKEPFILMGHSMGAMIALRYATMYKDRVRKLILTNMPVLMGPSEVKSQFLETNLLFKLALSRYTHAATWRTIRVLHALNLLPRDAMRRISGSKEYMFKHNAVSRSRTFKNVIMDAKVDLDLAAVQVKTLFLSGLHDKKLYTENLLNNIQLSPTVALQYVETGHHIPHHKPGLLIDSLRD